MFVRRRGCLIIQELCLAPSPLPGRTPPSTTPHLFLSFDPPHESTPGEYITVNHLECRVFLVKFWNFGLIPSRVFFFSSESVLTPGKSQLVNSTQPSTMPRVRKPLPICLLACLFCDTVANTRGNLNLHFDKTIPTYRTAFGHSVCPADRLHHLGIIRAHRMTANRPEIDIQETDLVLRLVLTEFARHILYETTEKKLPMRTLLCPVDAEWWQRAVDSVVAEFRKDNDRDELRKNVKNLVAAAKSLLENDISSGGPGNVNLRTGFAARDLVVNCKGDLVMTTAKGNSTVNNRRDGPSAAADKKSKAKWAATEKGPQAKQNEDPSDADDAANLADLTRSSSSSETDSDSDSESESDVEPIRRPRRRPAPESTAAPRPSAAKPTMLDPLFTLDVSILRRPTFAIPVYGNETLATVVATAWLQAPRAVRANKDKKVVTSDEKGWGGLWNERLWLDLVEAAGREVVPPVYKVIIEFEE